jgi:predicted nucleotidyltransferase
MLHIQSKVKEIENLCMQYKVNRLYAFGSVCRADFNEKSDVDFIVSFTDVPIYDYADYFFNLKEELEKVLIRKVDLVTEKSLENPYFVNVVNKTKTLIYERRSS